MLAFGRFFQDDDLGAEIMGGDGSPHTRCPEPDNDDIGIQIPNSAAPKVRIPSCHPVDGNP